MSKKKWIIGILVLVVISLLYCFLQEKSKQNIDLTMENLQIPFESQYIYEDEEKVN